MPPLVEDLSQSLLIYEKPILKTQTYDRLSFLNEKIFLRISRRDFRESIEIFWDSIRRQSYDNLIKPLLSCNRIPTSLLFVDILDFWEKISSQTRKQTNRLFSMRRFVVLCGTPIRLLSSMREGPLVFLKLCSYSSISGPSLRRLFCIP